MAARLRFPALFAASMEALAPLALVALVALATSACVTGTTPICGDADACGSVVPDAGPADAPPPHAEASADVGVTE